MEGLINNGEDKSQLPESILGSKLEAEEVLTLRQSQLDSIAFPSPSVLRPLAQVYCELGQTLFSSGLVHERQGQAALANRRYGQAAHAYLEALREYGKGDPQEIAVLKFYLAKARELQKRNLEAIQAYLEAVISNPAVADKVLPQAHHLLTPELAPSLKNPKEELYSLARSMPLDSEISPLIYNFVGRVDLLQGEYSEAVSIYKTALARNPESVYVREGLAEAFWHKNQVESALEVIRDAIRVADQRGDQERRESARLQYAGYLHKSNHYDEAREIAEAGIQISGRRAKDFLVILAQSNLKLGLIEDAAAQASEILSDQNAGYKHQRDALVIQAEIYYQGEAYQEAAETALRALEIEATHLPAIRLRGLALVDGKLGLEEGISLLQYYTGYIAMDLETQQILRHAMREAGRPASDIAFVVRQILDLVPQVQHAPLLFELAELSYEQGNYQETVEHLEEAAQIDPDVKTPLWWRLKGDARGKLNLTDEALADFEEALKLSPGDRELQDELQEKRAMLLLKTGKKIEAVAAWEAIVESRPDHALAHLGLAQSLFQSENFPRALEVVEALLELEVDERLEIEAMNLQGQILDTIGRPRTEIANIFYEHGNQKRYTGSYATAVEMYRSAREYNDNFLPIYWNWVETLRRWTYDISEEARQKQLLAEALHLWEEASQKGNPKQKYSWAYGTRSLLNLKSDHLPKIPRLWEGIVFLERAILLEPANATRWATLGNFHRALSNDSNSLAATARALKYNADDLWALDERGAILADTGQFAEAQQVIKKRLGIARDSWTEYVLAYILHNLDQYEEALVYIPEKTEYLWAIEVRATCLRMLGKRDEALQAYQRIWERFDPRDENQQVLYANAAAYLGILTQDPSQVTKAMFIYDQLKNNAIYALDGYFGSSMCNLYLGRVKKSEAAFQKGLGYAKNIRQIDGFLKLDLQPLKEHLISRPSSKSVPDWDVVLERIEKELTIRRKAVETLLTPEEELEQVIADLKAVESSQTAPASQNILHQDELAYEKDVKMTKILLRGAQAGLARLHLESRQWDKAAKVYQDLKKENSLFPEAQLGIQQVISGAQKQADNE